MSRLSIETPGRAQNVLDGLHRDMERRIGASAYGLCPVDMSLNYLRLCHAQTCGKCVPCRIGLGQLEVLIEQVLDRTATMETINIIERTAKVIADSAGCAIGYEAAYMVLKGIRGFREDYEEHVQHGRCISALSYPVPCVSACPAHVDVPGYVALVNEGKYEEAVKMLDSFNGKDQMVAPAILGAAGNCYAQLGQLDKAASTLLSAADKADNNTLSPIFLIQAGEILVKQGKYDDAVNAYTKIKDKYFQSYQAMDIDKYIEQAKLMKK